MTCSLNGNQPGRRQLLKNPFSSIETLREEKLIIGRGLPVTTSKPEPGSPGKPEPRHALLDPVKDIAPIIIYFYTSLEVVMRCFGGGKLK